MHTRCRALIVLAAITHLGLSNARANVAILPAARDSTLYESAAGDFANGGGEHFFAGSTQSGQLRRGIIGFDIAAAIPAGSVIQSVSLTLHMSRSLGGSSIIGLHRVNTDWSEGTTQAFGQEGNGAPSQAGDVTWIHTSAFDSLWSNPGGDFETDPSAEAVVTGVQNYSWRTTPMLVADVQAWLDNPGTNFGWLLAGDEDNAGTAKRFDTRENTDARVQPFLTVDYQPVPEPASLLLLAAGAWLTRARLTSRRR